MNLSIQIHALKKAFLLAVFICIPATLQAGIPEAYQQAIQLAAQNNSSQATASLNTLIEALPHQPAWQERLQAARQLINMRMNQQSNIPPQSSPNAYLTLASAYANNHPQPHDMNIWPATILATIFPGSGHAWQGRWRDASTAALMVWPMLLLTLWSFKRGMGPVTVFFALITVWLWSGTVFSSVSLAERGNLESYLMWWQSVWQASGLPGRPW
ncbi:MAG: hypothetical protein JKY87_03685 [Mariprofundus sp.]|nr:hypothetical protein [Mariprofundus sp.]